MPQRKRPVGVTILALVYLWIGCFGTLVFPFIALNGGSSQIWRHWVAGAIHSEPALRVTGHIFTLIWFLWYVAYGVIGFGLWKLRNWAYRAILVMNEFFVVVCLLVLPFLVRPPALAVAVVIGTAIPFACIVWYLKQPNVGFAFGARPAMER